MEKICILSLYYLQAIYGFYGHFENTKFEFCKLITVKKNMYVVVYCFKYDKQ